jgi:hypothetical protein
MSRFEALLPRQEAIRQTARKPGSDTSSLPDERQSNFLFKHVKPLYRNKPPIAWAVGHRNYFSRTTNEGSVRESNLFLYAKEQVTWLKVKDGRLSMIADIRMQYELSGNSK